MLSKMSKENLELLSYTKIAEMYLKENKKTMNTAELFKEVCKLLELSDEEYQDKIADILSVIENKMEINNNLSNELEEKLFKLDEDDRIKYQQALETLQYILNKEELS